VRPFVRRHSAKTAALFLLAFSAGCAGQDVAVHDLASLHRADVTVQAAAGEHRFHVWLASTPEEQAQGLMFVRDLPADQGMLFPNPQPRVVSFWMKNTYIELDLLFIGQDHRILKIAPRATPLSLETISSDKPAIAVLEIRGGEAERRSIKTGDRVSW